MRQEPSPLLRTVADAALMLSVSPRTVWRLVDEGSLPAARVRGATRIPDAAILDYAAKAARWHRPVRRTAA
jgi:excisionase family DNA binding protein